MTKNNDQNITKSRKSPEEVQAAYRKLSTQARQCFNDSIFTETSKPGMAHWHIPMFNLRVRPKYEKFDCEIFCELVEFMKLSGLNQRIYEIEILDVGITADQIFAILSEPAFPMLEELYVIEIDVCLQLVQRRAELIKLMPGFRLLGARGESTPEGKPIYMSCWIGS